MACRFIRSMMLFTVRVQWGETAEKRNDENGGYKHAQDSGFQYAPRGRGRRFTNIRQCTNCSIRPGSAENSEGNRKITC